MNYLLLLHDIQTLVELVRQASSPSEPALIPSRAFLSPPGGKLVETLVGHTSGVYGLAATRNGGFAVTGDAWRFFHKLLVAPHSPFIWRDLVH